MPEALRLGVLATHPVQYHAPLYRALRSAGADVTVFFAHRPSAAEQGVGFGVAFQWDVDLTGGYAHRFLTNRARHPSVASFFGCDVPELRAQITRQRFDAFLVSGWHSLAYWQAVRACRAAGLPVMVRGDSQLDPRIGLTKRLAKRASYPWMIGRFDVCLSVGTRSSEYFRAYGARRVVRAPHFVDNSFFAARSALADRRVLRERWGLPADATVFLFAGKLVSWKRPMDLLRAATSLNDPRIAVLIAGDGELRESCEAMTRGAAGAIRFAGFLNQTEMASAYAAADVLVLPSEARETWGLVVNEAMASGLPAIVSWAAGCAPDLIVEGVTGFTYTVGDVTQLSALLRRMADRFEERQAMARAARRHVEQFTPAAAAAGVMQGAEAAGARRAA